VYYDLNSNAQAYFGADIDGFKSSTVVSILETTESDPTTTYTYAASTLYDTIWTNSAGDVVNTNDRQPGVTITFDTPFVYLPVSSVGSTGLPGDRCRIGSSNEGFGYPPQTLLDFMVNNPSISRQYPGLASCLPGGPSLLAFSKPYNCSLVAPVVQCANPSLFKPLHS
jgi:hypothetical protein